jgi:nucleoside-diphosphate-sugar epimerase
LESAEIALFGEGEEIRPHLWIEDCVAWILEAISTQWRGTLNIVPRDAVSFLNLAGMISEVVQKSVQLRKIPRRQPVTHRSFDPSKREELWPELPATPLSYSLRRLAETLQLA